MGQVDPHLDSEVPTWGGRRPDYIHEEEGAIRYVWVDGDDEVVFSRTVYERAESLSEEEREDRERGVW